MSIVIGVFRLIVPIMAIVLALLVLRVSRSVRRDMAELKCPHCHKPIFPRLP